MSNLARMEALLIETNGLLRASTAFAREQAETVKAEIARSAERQQQLLRNQEIAIWTQRANAKMYRIIVTVAAATLILSLLSMINR
jgi:ElaB/YqjD/DUF883 family membrane-anchored ribosome-binding protein